MPGPSFAVLARPLSLIVGLGCFIALTLFSGKAHAQNAPADSWWRSCLGESVARPRTATLGILVNDETGKPVRDANVQADLILHGFERTADGGPERIGLNEDHYPTSPWDHSADSSTIVSSNQTTSDEGLVAFDGAFFGDYVVTVTRSAATHRYRVRHVRGAATTILSLAETTDGKLGEPPVVCFAPLKRELQKRWPKNRLIRFVFHGHSVPAGYFNTPVVRRYDAYPTLFHQKICEIHPTVPIDLAVTAIGGEQSERGAARFESDVLSLRPDVVFIDYAMNDRGIGLKRTRVAWQSMIEACLQRGIPVVLLTSTPALREDILRDDSPLALHAAQTRRLGQKYKVPVVDNYAKFKSLVEAGAKTNDFLSHPFHPNRAGHEVAAEMLLDQFEWFQ